MARKLTLAQWEWLELMRAQEGPIKIPKGTGEALRRMGLATFGSIGYGRITEEGRKLLDSNPKDEPQRARSLRGAAP